MKFHPASKPPVTGPVVTGRNSEVSTPTSFDPAKASEDGYQTAAFQIAGPIVQKSLEQFLSCISPATIIHTTDARIAAASTAYCKSRCFFSSLFFSNWLLFVAP